jgi:hypothetical protein
MLSVGVTLAAPPAASAACSDEQAEFAHSVISSSNSGTETSHGSDNTFILLDRDLSDTCSVHKTGSTAHIVNGGSTYNQVEIGYTEGGDPHGTHNFYLFEEFQNGSVTGGGNEDGGQLSGTPPQGTGWTFQVVYSSGNDDWHFFFNTNDGSGRRKLFSLTCNTDPAAVCASVAGMDHGIAEGETWRTGGTGTGASDHHYNLQQWNQSAGAWQSWDWAAYNSSETSGDGLQISNWYICEGHTQYWMVRTDQSCP